MTLLETASNALKVDSCASDTAIEFLFATLLKSIHQSVEELEAMSPTRILLKPLLHKLKGELLSLNLDI